MELTQMATDHRRCNSNTSLSTPISPTIPKKWGINTTPPEGEAGGEPTTPGWSKPSDRGGGFETIKRLDGEREWAARRAAEDWGAESDNGSGLDGGGGGMGGGGMGGRGSVGSAGFEAWKRGKGGGERGGGDMAGGGQRGGKKGKKFPMPTMDDYMFREHVRRCKVVGEETRWLEIFNYEGRQPDYREEHPLPQDEYLNFFNRTGVFSPPKVKEGSRLLNGIRLVIQKKAQHPDTFASQTISFPHWAYESMVRGMRLPYRGIESTSVVGPFFWSAIYQPEGDPDLLSFPPGLSPNESSSSTSTTASLFPPPDHALDSGSDSSSTSHDPAFLPDPHLQIIFRKSDVRKKGKTRGWEIMLSHSFRTRITTGFIKGTPTSDVEIALQHLRACARQVAHPMLLPVIVLSLDMNGKDEVRQRDARDWTRRLENAISMRDEIENHERLYVREEGGVDLDAINRDLVECHSQVLWKRPRAYKEVIREVERGMGRFAETGGAWAERAREKERRRRERERKEEEGLAREGKGKSHRHGSSDTSDSDEGTASSSDGDGSDAGDEKQSIGSQDDGRKQEKQKQRRYIKRHAKATRKRGKKTVVSRRRRYGEEDLDTETRSLHRSMLGRLEFYTCKLMGIENYAHTTLERLNIQREVLYSIHARTSSKLSLKMTSEQKRLSHASKRDSSAMKTLSLMGAMFLPATFISSVFSMTFFDFQVGDESPFPADPRTVSPDLWIYFAITMPVTVLIVWGWWFTNKHREKKYKQEEDSIDNEIEMLEREIVKSLRKKTNKKVNTWETLTTGGLQGRRGTS